MMRGKYISDIFLVPTIRIYDRYIDYTDIELCWLRWYIGVRIERKEPHGFTADEWYRDTFGENDGK